MHVDGRRDGGRGLYLGGSTPACGWYSKNLSQASALDRGEYDDMEWLVQREARGMKKMKK